MQLELHVHLRVRNTTHCVVLECTILVNVYLITVSCLACADWTTSHCADVLHACGPHKVCTRLVLWPVQAEVPTHLRQLPRRCRGRRQYISGCECGTAGRDTEWGACGAWASYLGVHFRRLKQYQHFIFSATHPGVVTLKEHSNSSEETFTMLDSGSWSPVASELPPLIKPSGLPLERQWYLHKQIRPYCREGTEDLTCPKPSLSLDNTTNTTTKKTNRGRS